VSPAPSPAPRALAEATRLLTTLALRPDVASPLLDLHLALQSDYDRLRAALVRRDALLRELARTEARIEDLEPPLRDAVAATRFALRACGMAELESRPLDAARGGQPNRSTQSSQRAA
jgi:hypothetical protein